MASNRIPDPVYHAGPQFDYPDAAALASPARRRPFIYIGFLIGAALICTVVGFQIAPLAKSQESGNSSMWKDDSGPMVRALVFVAKNQPRILPDPQDQSQASESESELFRQIQICLVKSRFVLNEALKQRAPEPVAELSIIKEQTDPIRWLEKNLHVGFIDKTECLRIGLSGAPSNERIQLVNAVVRAYVNEIVDKEKKSRLDRMEQLKRILAIYDERRQAQRRMFEDLVNTTRTANARLLDLKQDVASAQLTEFTRELSRVRFNKILLLAQIQVKKAGNKANQEPQAVFDKLEEEVAILSAQDKLIEKHMEVLVEEKALEKTKLDLEPLREDIRMIEQTRKKIALEIEKLELDAFAPSRILKLEDAS